MAPFTKLLSSVLIALLYTSATTAMPSPSYLKHSTHRTRSIGSRGELKLETFHPESTFEGYGVDGLDHPLARRGGFDIKTASVSFLASKLGISQDGVKFRTSAEAQTAQHAFLQQQINGVPVANAVANVAFNSNGKVVSFSSSFVKTSNNADKNPTVSLADAISTAEQALGGTYNGHPATLEFLVQPDDSAALTHVIQIQNEKEGKWFEAFVDAHSNKLLSVTDFVTKASYLVLPINEEVLTQGFQTLTDPQDLTASPDGWHSDGTTSTTTTAGNNVIAFKGSTTGVTSQSSSGLNFIYTQNAGVAPTTATNVAAAVTNAFYIVNSVHDLSYNYGFTEATFNFQKNNFGKGGLGNDRVTVSVQDSAGVDNADFSTPQMDNLGLCPERDGALENDIVIHENTHGITNRMTGGGPDVASKPPRLGAWARGGQILWRRATTVDFVLGQYVTDNPAGIRSNPYSTSALQTLTEVHAIGEVWANMLHNVYASLVAAFGWSATARTNPNTTEGNVVFMHLFLDSLLLQPCNPTFLTARDAWIQADANRFGGANNCLLWNAFASRGLGVNAANFVDDSTVPAGC
ncbi:Fungalysin metallopeptidase-domain-containing protein [Multifurca ochricompacta]|uniref:Extracellular metalloproteinase n=1 Tax=Multifurca ochricompacta TaxID=376703 RepID=A0AAD4LW61_9AGAM|nr:Fungalysin metallopeptidase-domain-containing protein [Multifurca ochricompacta]